MEREQLKWLVYAGALIVVAAVAETPIEKILGPGSSAAVNLENAVITSSVALVSIAIGIAIFRYHLYDIDVVINKTLVYGSLAVFITGVYVAIVVGLGSLAHSAAHGRAWSCRSSPRPSLPWRSSRSGHGSSAWPTGWSTAGGPPRTRCSRDFAERMAGTYAAEDLLPRMARILAEGTARPPGRTCG